MREVWKKTEYKDYEVSNYGRVRSLHNRSCDKYILNQRLNRCGYKTVWITQDGAEYNKTVHRLVAKAFINNKKLLPQVNHIDGDKTNNNVTNLEWCNQSQNQLHAYRELGNGGGASGEEHWNSKLDWELVGYIRELYSLGFKITEISKIIGIHRRTISDVINYNTWKDES